MELTKYKPAHPNENLRISPVTNPAGRWIHHSLRGHLRPAVSRKPGILSAFAGGFVNPYATGYALDAFCTWGVLAVWVVYEAKAKGFRHGWVALVLGVVPDVAVGFACYLLLQLKQEQGQEANPTQR